MNDFDLIILGGGCAGLSLGKSLAQAGGAYPRTLILEARGSYSNDRTWCFWKNDLLPCQDLVTHEWGTMRVACAQNEVTLSSHAKPYQMLPAGIFYEAAVTAIDRSGHVTLVMNAAVKSIPSKIGGRWTVETSEDTFTAAAVVDTRPKKLPNRGDAILWQSFVGHEIECDRDVFDPNMADLMDFSPPNAARIQFTYMLPTTPRRALIEITVFGPDPLNSAALLAELNTNIEQKAGGSFTVVRTEHGILPMGMIEQEQDPDETYVRVGLTAGGARASTGYAFQRIQRWASSCAAKLASGADPIGHARDPLLLRMMDRLFLRVLKANCQIAPQMFVSLFKEAETERVIRFLSDQGTAMDHIKTVLSLPPQPFLREIMRPLQSEFCARQKALEP
jgi:lycopene beta-cyclase